MGKCCASKMKAVLVLFLALTAAALHAHLELASDIYAVELAGNSIFAF